MKKIIIGLVGNPNSGKSTLFNALTGLHQTIGNWPGVTVEQKSGFFEFDNIHVEILDLPGLYSLTAVSETSSIDEQIASKNILTTQFDLIVNVVNANNLERNLYLTSQLLELDAPLIVALNMVDIAKKHGVEIKTELLAKQLGCQIVPLIANKKRGVDELKKTIITAKKIKAKKPNYPAPINEALIKITDKIAATNTKNAYFIALKLLENAASDIKLPKNILEFGNQQQQEVEQLAHEDADILIAGTRFDGIHNIINKTVVKITTCKQSTTKSIDKIVLNRALSIPIFLLLMYLLFFITINIGTSLQNIFHLGSDLIFVHLFSQLLILCHCPAWLTNILITGLGKGISTTITFIPILTIMFLCLAFLENTGYMARAGFVIDRLMGTIGLPGKSFIPMLIGFGCNVPAIMAARTLEHSRDRILTIMMTPFMSCSARLAVYAVFVAAFFPNNGQNIVFALYIIGIIIAIITGLILRKTILRGQQSPLIMELPTYQLPLLHDVITQTWCRLKAFIGKAGKIIIPVCILIGALNNIPLKDSNALSVLGKTITPVFKPIGITEDNWPATVGLITGVMAKEVVIGTLNTLYTAQSFRHPHAISTTTKKSPPHKNIYGKMYKNFHSPIAAFAYLLFILLYFPCIAALVTIYRELNWRWALFSMAWNTSLAYIIALLFYQIAMHIVAL